MLKQASVQEISQNRVTKIHGQLIVVTRFYPRFLKRNLVHEYLSELAPSRELLAAFKSAEADCGDHDEGFRRIDYESRFELTEEGLHQLARISTLALNSPVYLICHCNRKQACHRELLMLMAHHLHSVAIGSLSRPYETFLKRLKGNSG